jgi:tetratricopeptide (TPR) repeat protein
MKKSKKQKIQHYKKEAESTVHTSKGKKRIHLFAIIIFALAFLIYANSIKNGYVLDDYSVIKEHLTVKKGFDGIKEIWKTTYRFGYWGHPDDLYRPLTLTVFAIQWELWPDNPFPAHLFNVLLYSLLCVLIFFLLRRIFSEAGLWLPLITTLIFAAHPIHTEVVANIKSLDELLCLFFLLISTWYLLDFAEMKKAKHLIIALVSYLLAFFSKESAITFLAVFPLVLFFATDAPRRKIITLSLLMLIPAVIFLIARQKVVGSVTGNTSVSVVDNLLSAAETTSERTATAFKIMGIYLVKQFYPHPLACDYSYNQIPIVNWSDIKAILSFVVHVFLAVFALWNIRKKTVWSFAILFYFITLSLYTNLVFQIGSSFGERFLFVPSLGVALCVTWLMLRYLSADSLKSESRFPASPVIWITVIILVLFSGKTIIRNSEWLNNETLYEADVMKSPNSAHMRYYYGLSLMKEKSLDEQGKVVKPEYLDSAIAQFEIAAEIYPPYADAYDQLGLAWFRKKDYGKSIFYYQKTLEFNPTKAITYSNMGSIYFEAGQYDKALEVYRKAVELNPLFSDAWMNLGSTLGTMGMLKESENAFLKCIELKPENALAHYYLGLTYNSMGDTIRGNQYIGKASQMNPQMVQQLQKPPQ